MICKHKCEREQSQTREICFEVRAPLLYVPAINTMKDFHQNRSHWITRCCNTYNEFTFELTSPSLVPTRTTHASILACRGCTSYNSSNHTSEHLVITSLDHHKTLFNTKMKLVITSLDHKNNSHNKASIG